MARTREHSVANKISPEVVGSFGALHWVAGIYLGANSGALTSGAWLRCATPDPAANTVTVNPIAAVLLATELVGEPITLNPIVGLVAVFIGIWIRY